MPQFNACRPCTMAAGRLGCTSSSPQLLEMAPGWVHFQAPPLYPMVPHPCAGRSDRREGGSVEPFQRSFCLRMWGSLGCQKQSSRCPESCTYPVPWVHSRVAPGKKPNPWPEKLLRYLYSRATHQDLSRPRVTTRHSSETSHPCSQH